MVDLINIQDIKKAYFIGIGGIGMSAIARFFKSRGAVVAGYDKTPTALTNQLSEEGIAVHYNDDVAMFPTDANIVVYTRYINIFMRCAVISMRIKNCFKRSVNSPIIV